MAHTSARAEQQFATEAGEYTVHHSLFPSSFLQPKIASSYNITRSRDRLVLNVSVTRGNSAEVRTQSARVSGTRSDLIHTQPIEFREIREKDAVYYIAEIRATSEAVYYFDLKVQPDPNRPPISVKFNRRVAPEK
jgi:hypothetical protein